MNKPVSTLGLTMDAAESRRDRLALMLKWGLVTAVIIIAPLAFTLLAHVAALVVCGCLAVSAVAFAPVVALKLANWKMTATLREVRANPMPTLENALIQKRDALRQAREQLQAGLASAQRFVEQAADAAKQFPDAAARWTERAAKAQALAAARTRSYGQAAAAVDAFEREVERCRTEWQLVVAEAAMKSSLTDVLRDPLHTLIDKTAIEEVTLRMNRAFAELEIALAEDEAATRMATRPALQGPMPSIRIDRLPRS